MRIETCFASGSGYGHAYSYLTVTSVSLPLFNFQCLKQFLLFWLMGFLREQKWNMHACSIIFLVSCMCEYSSFINDKILHDHLLSQTNAALIHHFNIRKRRKKKIYCGKSKNFILLKKKCSSLALGFLGHDLRL